MAIDITLVPEDLRDWVLQLNAFTPADWRQVTARWHPQNQLLALQVHNLREETRIAKLRDDPESLDRMVDKYVSDDRIADGGPPLFCILACLNDSALELLVQTLDPAVLKMGGQVAGRAEI